MSVHSVCDWCSQWPGKGRGLQMAGHECMRVLGSEPGSSLRAALLLSTEHLCDPRFSHFCISCKHNVLISFPAAAIKYPDKSKCKGKSVGPTYN